MYKFPFIVISLFLLSCTSGQPATVKAQKPSDAESGNGSGAYTLEITPTDPTRNSILTLTPKGFNLSQARIMWLVNDMIDSNEATFKATRAAKGDTIQAKAILRDTEIFSNSVKIGNAPPEVASVKLLPEVFKPGDRLGVEPVGTDADGDAVTFLYEWTVNGEPAGNGKNLDRPLRRGDHVSVKITPYDGADYGNPVVIQKEIRNMPPVIVDHKEFSFDGTVYTYQVKASDPDGDTLTYSLESPLNGMTIDPSSGLLKWVVPSEFKGKKDVTVVVSDGNGGSAKYNIDITIQ